MKEPINDFGHWLLKNRYTDKAFAELLSAELKEEVGATTVYKWRREGVIPHARRIRAITKLTKGAITADSFVDQAA